MTEKAAKAERSLANTCAKLGITETGKRWLDLCLDPFKDLNMPTAGYPDAVTIPSVVQTIHDSYSVAVPASVAAGANWDCNVFLDQLYNTQELNSVPFNPAVNLATRAGQGIVAYKRGGLVVRSGPAGSALAISSTTFGADLKQDVLNEGDTRLIGIGMEIHNTTGELYKQGALVCYRVPDAPVSDLTINLLEDYGLTACTPLAMPGVFLTDVPSTASEAIDLPGSLQWEAKDGAYIVPILTSPVNYPSEPEPLLPIEKEGSNYYLPTLTSIGVQRVIQPFDDVSNLIHGFSTSGVYLTGLSYQTTLQVNLTYYVEVFPKITSVLRRSVQPAPGLDAKALDLYAHIVSHLPCGVEVNDNFLGAFIAGIARIASTVGRVVPTVMRGLGAVSDVANVIQGLGSSDAGSRSLRAMRREDNAIEEVNSPAIIRDMNRAAIVPRAGPVVSDLITRNGKEIVTQVNRSGVTRTEFVPSVNRNNGPSSVRTQKARDKKNRIIDNATKGYAGNRWIDNPKRK